MFNEINILGQSTSWLEIAAMLTGVAGVWLTLKQSIFCFPVGIVNVALYALLFISPGIRLYADALLQCIYILLLFYGWLNWSGKKNNIIFPINLEKKLMLKISLICFFATVILAVFLQKFTDASYPWLDSALTCASLAAQWMIAKKIIENWIVWIVVDLIYLPLYYFKHLPLTVLLYFVFVLLAFKGYSEWKKNLISRAA